MFQNKFKRRDDKASPCFKPFLTRTFQMFAYSESNVGYIQNHFNSPKELHRDRKVGDNIT